MWGARVIDGAARLTLSVSPGLDAILRSHGARGRIERFYNIHNAIDSTIDTAFSPRRENRWGNEPILIYVGGLQPGFRGLEDQISAVRELHRRGIAIRFLILYGSGDDAMVRASGADLIDAGIIKLYQNASPSQVRSALRESTLAVNKTLSYALPSKIFEYIAAGVRILSVDRDDDVTALFPQFVQRYRDTQHDLVEAMQAALTGATERAQHAQEGRNTISDLLSKNRDALGMLDGII